MSARIRAALCVALLTSCGDDAASETATDGAASEADGGSRDAAGGGSAGDSPVLIITGGGSGGDGSSPDSGLAEIGCVVAVRLDDCCRGTVPASHAELKADSCLVPYPVFQLDAELESGCENRGGVDCSLVDCEPQRPLSRTAISDGATGCEFGDECETAADCVFATDVRPCCSCPSPVPRELADRDPCLVEAGEDPNISGCMQCASRPACGACEEPGALACEQGPIFSVCTL